MSDESPNAMIRRAAEHLRQESRRHQPGGPDERFLLAVATWLDDWYPFGLSDEAVSDYWAPEWVHAKHVARPALGEVEP